MTRPVGLVTGSQPFAGLPTNPAADLLPTVHGRVFGGVTIHAEETPVSLAALPTHLPALVARHRPAFVLAIGLALGANTVRAETMAINAAHFGMPDAAGALPQGGARFDAEAPEARRATWDAAAVVAAIQDAGVPARLSFHAGTHLCNLTLFTYLGALDPGVPCGFLHVPYTPEQVVWMMRHRAGGPHAAPGVVVDQPSMALETQRKALEATLQALARQASPDP